MAENLNGAEQAHPATNGLREAIERHGRALIQANMLPNGGIALNPVELFCNQELLSARVAVLFEALCEGGMLDPAKLPVLLRDKLNAEALQLEQAAKDGPRIVTPNG